jgi:two-component system NtrC family response regulator
LRSLISEGKFREDLYYRLSEIVLNIPPLRDREGDPLLLANALVSRFRLQEGRGALSFAPEAIAAIESHTWPGNVREMENCIKRAVVLAEGSQITLDDLGLPGAGSVEPEPLNLRQVREEAERKAIVKALSRSDNNVAKAADLLGVSRPTLYDLLARFGLK